MRRRTTVGIFSGRHIPWMVAPLCALALLFIPLHFHAAHAGGLESGVESREERLPDGEAALPEGSDKADALSVGAAPDNAEPMPPGSGVSLPTVLGEVGLWTGAATARIPIEVPSGPGGLTPKLALVYSSDAAVDVAYKLVHPNFKDPVTGMNIGHNVQASPFGYGWDMDGIPAIILVPAQVEFNDQGYGYELSVNGKRFRLAHRGRDETSVPGQTTTWYESYPQYFVYVKQVEVEANGQLVSHTWYVKTPDGREYQFGGTHSGEERNSMQEAYTYDCVEIVPDQPCQNVTFPLMIRWQLTRIRDTHCINGNPTKCNEIYFTYRRETARVTYESFDYDSAVTISTIQYGAPLSNPGDYKFRVRFAPETTVRPDCVMDDANGNPWLCPASNVPTVPFPPVLRTRYRIDSIVVEAKVGTTWTALRTYDLNYSTIGSSNRFHSLLTEVRLARNGSSLPLHVMTYVGQDQPATFTNWAPLRTIQNNYGGRAEFAYEPVTFTVKHFFNDNPGYDPPPDENFQRRRQRVSQSKLYDRDWQRPISQTDYSYDTPMGSEYYASNYGGIYHDWYEFLGYRQVVETLKDSSGAVLQQTVTNFLQKLSRPDNCPEPHPARGQILSRFVRQNEGTTVLQEINNNWQVEDSVNLPVFDGFFQGNPLIKKSKWAWLKETIEKSRWESSEVGRRTGYAYAPNLQNGRQFGNLTTTMEYANLTDTAPYRVQYRWYFPNTNDWIIDRVAAAAVIAGSEWKSNTWNFYDGNISHVQPPGAKGELKRVVRLEPVSQLPAGMTWSGCVYPSRTIEAEYVYDDYGNRTQEISYSGYGYMCQDSGYNVLARSSDKLPTTQRTTWTVYEGTYNAFLTRTVSPAVNGRNKITYKYYYGVNSSTSLSNAGSFFGMLETVKDVNGNDTKYRYDAFGRPWKVIRPGDSDSNPTVQYAYYDPPISSDKPFMKVTWRKGDPTKATWTSGGVWEREFLDGLGRTLQVQKPHENWQNTGAGQDVVRFITYDARGLKAEESVPYLMPAYAFGTGCVSNAATTCNTYVAPDQTKPGTTYTYDALGRVLIQTDPAGFQTHHVYEIWEGLRTEQLIDSNRHRKQYRYDAFGRLVRVYEIFGNCGRGSFYANRPEWSPYLCNGAYTSNWWAYSATRYAYDVFDRLTDVCDGKNSSAECNNTTSNVHLTYDLFGRKTEMRDPDLGTWFSDYDAVGNVTRQTDAKGQTTCLYYDRIDRLKGKTYQVNNPVCSQTDPDYAGYAVKFIYDAEDTRHGEGAGRLTQTETTGSNPVVVHYQYDTRGRITKVE